MRPLASGTSPRAEPTSLDASSVAPNGEKAPEPAGIITWSAPNGASVAGGSHAREAADPPNGSADEG